MKKTLRKVVAVLFALACCCRPVVAWDENPPASVPYQMQLPTPQRVMYRNPDGSCVQCSNSMTGTCQNEPAFAYLLWDSPYGKAVRGGSYPSRVEDYAERRHVPIYNVTGTSTWEWMRWACKTGRFAAIGAGRAHFQTLYGWDDKGTESLDDDVWYVCNNNSPSQVDAYSWRQFQSLHLASGQWIVVIDRPPPAATPRYVKWW